MAKNEYHNEKPSNIEEYIALANDISNYRNRLNAIDFLSKNKCNESKKELFR